MRHYKSFVERQKYQWGDKFDTSELCEKFIPYFESGQRIIIKDKWGKEYRGYVGVTTGWKPSFLLCFRSNSYSSWYTLNDNDTIVGTVERYW